MTEHYEWLTVHPDGYSADTRGVTPVEADRRLVIMQELAAGRLVPADHLAGAVEALRLLWDDIREADKRFVPDDVRARVEAVLPS